MEDAAEWMAIEGLQAEGDTEVTGEVGSEAVADCKMVTEAVAGVKEEEEQEAHALFRDAQQSGAKGGTTYDLLALVTGCYARVAIHWYTVGIL